MSSHSESRSDHSVEQIKPFALLKDTWAELLSRKIRVIYDESAPSGRQKVGTRRSDLTVAGGNLGVARYGPEYARQTASLLGRYVELANVEHLIGHIDFNIQLSDAALEGVVYLTSDERATGFLDMNIAAGQGLARDSQACYDFAEKIGVASSWFRSVAEAEVSDQPYHNHASVELNEPAQLQLNMALQEVKST